MVHPPQKRHKCGSSVTGQTLASCVRPGFAAPDSTECGKRRRRFKAAARSARGSACREPVDARPRPAPPAARSIFGADRHGQRDVPLVVDRLPIAETTATSAALAAPRPQHRRARGAGGRPRSRAPAPRRRPRPAPQGPSIEGACARSRRRRRSRAAPSLGGPDRERPPRPRPGPARRARAARGRRRRPAKSGLRSKAKSGCTAARDPPHRRRLAAPSPATKRSSPSGTRAPLRGWIEAVRRRHDHRRRRSASRCRSGSRRR